MIFIKILKNIWIVFDDMIADILSNKKLNPIVTELNLILKKIKYFSCFYYATLFCCSKKYYTKLDIILL